MYDVLWLGRTLLSICTSFVNVFLQFCDFVYSYVMFNRTSSNIWNQVNVDSFAQCIPFVWGFIMKASLLNSGDHNYISIVITRPTSGWFQAEIYMRRSFFFCIFTFLLTLIFSKIYRSIRSTCCFVISSDKWIVCFASSQTAPVSSHVNFRLSSRTRSRVCTWPNLWYLQARLYFPIILHFNFFIGEWRFS